MFRCLALLFALYGLVDLYLGDVVDAVVVFGAAMALGIAGRITDKI